MTGIMFARVHARAVGAFAHLFVCANQTIRKSVACALALLLSCAVMPAAAFAADEEGAADAEGQSEGLAIESSDSEEGEGAFGSEVPTSPQPPSPSSKDDPGIVASTLLGKPTAFVNADVALDGDPVVGSFTVDGLTFSISDDGATLVAVAPGAFGVDGPDGGRGEVSPSGTSFASGTSEPGALAGPSAIPSSVAYDGVGYDVVAIGSYAFYLSGATSVALPGTIASVDDRAFRSSDVARVEVDPANPGLASFDGCLYDSQLTRLLLIPEGRSEGVRIPYTAEEVPADAFSHVSSVDAIFVDADCPTYSSEDGLLYDATGLALLRVPAGATDITIREGCTTIAAGAMEGCAKLETIYAPSTVTSISPDVFVGVPTVSLPAVSLVEAGDAAGSEGAEEGEGAAPQLTAMVSLSSAEGLLRHVDASSIHVLLPSGAEDVCWLSAQFDVVPSAEFLSKGLYSDDFNKTNLYARNGGGYLNVTYMKPASGEGMGLQTWVGIASGYTGLTLNVNANGSFSMAISSIYAKSGVAVADVGYYFAGWNADGTNNVTITNRTFSQTSGVINVYAVFKPITYTVSLDAQTGEEADVVSAVYDEEAVLPVPARPGWRFLGWNTAQDGSGPYFEFATNDLAKLAIADGNKVTLYAQWECVDFDVSFDTDSEPGDEDYPGDAKPDETLNVEDGIVEIENPTRPGYVFQGWAIPNAGGTEAIDQELVYEEDGKWYVDASKLPDYAGDDGKVELTARWTSVISVDVPNSVTFYADTVTQGSESRDGLADRAFGQSKVQSQSQVDLRIVGLESQEIEGDGSTSLGASDVLVSKGASTPADSAWKLFSLYPSATELTPEELQDPDRVSAAPEGGVTFGLDDILLERSFSADDFTIPAGDTLSLGYRLNLAETGTSLDYGKLSQLPEGSSAALANISYCFAADGLTPADWDEPLWFENRDPSLGRTGFHCLSHIKAAAEDLSACEAAGDVTASEHYALYKGLLDAQVTDNATPGVGPYLNLRVNGEYVAAQVIGICQDAKSAGGKAGLTLQLRDVYPDKVAMNPTDTNAGGWAASGMRSWLRGTFASRLDESLVRAIVPLDKWQQLPGGTTGAYLQRSTGETIWLPSVYEMYGTTFSSFNEAEGLAGQDGYEPFQYQAFQPGGQSKTNLAARKRYSGGAFAYWWLRSAYRTTTTNFCGIYTSGGLGYNAKLASGVNGVDPCFAL